jgi:hypothetical protein
MPLKLSLNSALNRSSTALLSSAVATVAALLPLVGATRASAA